MSNAIIFIPRSPFLNSDRVMPTLGPLYLKSFLESKGHSIYVNDFSDVEDISDLEDFDVIGISTTTPQYYEGGGGRDLGIALKEKYPNKKIIIGGAHAKNYFEETIKENIFDNIFRGDGELAFLDLLNGKEMPQVVSYPSLTKEEINSFPIPWRNEKYLGKYSYKISDKKSTTAMAGRYCSMKCKFCEERDSKLILYNVDKVKQDLKKIKEIGFNGLMFYDDILTVNESRTRDLCRIIKSLDLVFRCNGHVGILSRNNTVLEDLVSAGCDEICLGIESGDQETLSTIGKGNKVEQIFLATQNILDKGMKISSYLMIGLPGESKKTIENTEKYIAKFQDNPNFNFDLTIFYPYRYTYIRENIKEFDLNLHLENSKGLYKGIDGSSECCVSTSSLNREDIINERKRIIETYKKNFRGYQNPKHDNN